MKILAMVGLVLMLGGCGYKGNLYLPKDNDAQTFGVLQTGFGLDEGAVRINPTTQSAPQPY